MGSSYRKNNITENISYLLDSTNVKEIKLAKEITEKRLKFWWAHYSDLATQRHVITTDLKNSIIKNCTEFRFDKWQRAVKYKYSLHPLSTIGSYQFIGGRFNYGNCINENISPIPTLYIASDKDTSLQEHLGQGIISPNSGLTARDLALSSTASETIVSVSGKIEQIIDLTNEQNLIEFIGLISAFKIGSYLTQLARDAHLGKTPLVIKSVSKLLESLLDPHWRMMPSNYDIPSNSQIFGHLCYTAGIEGVLYPSKLTGKPCLAIFPTNFKHSSSYIQLDDELPYKNIVMKIDKDNYHKCEIHIKDLL